MNQTSADLGSADESASVRKTLKPPAVPVRFTLEIRGTLIRPVLLIDHCKKPVFHGRHQPAGFPYLELQLYTASRSHPIGASADSQKHA
jgi:hypothetical protein